MGEIDKPGARLSFKDGKVLNTGECIQQALSQKFGLDLLEGCLGHVEFLLEVDKHQGLYKAECLKNAKRRYEHLWLPLAAEHDHERLAAPLDIEWIWHCHLLCPSKYEQDCISITRRRVNHRLYRWQDREHALKRSRHLWEQKYKNEPFEIELSDHALLNSWKGNDIDSQITYNLDAAVSRQGNFCYNVSLPHFRDMKYLYLCLQRYQKFLFLRKNSINLFIVPCYDQDLMWHTHQLHPFIYKDDTERLLGKLLDHDDSVTDRSPGSKLSTSFFDTRRLWREMFGEEFNMAGAMYRGNPPSCIYSHVPSHGDTIASDLVLTLNTISLDRIPEGDHGFDFKLKIYIVSDTENCKNSTKDLYGPSMVWTSDELFSMSISPDKIVLFRMYLKKGTFFSKNVMIGSGVLQLSHFTEKSSSYRFNESVVLDGDDKNILYVSGSVTKFYTEKEFQLSRGGFMVCNIPTNVERTFTITPTEEDPLSSCAVGYIARHKISCNHFSEDIECVVIHCPHRLLSEIQFRHQEELLCSAKLVDSFDLPLSVQVSNPNWYPTLDPHLEERAVIVRDKAGDWAILTARWNTQGLLLKYHKTMDSYTQQMFIPVTAENNYSFSVDNNEIFMKNGKFVLHCAADETLPYLATGMAISMLNVLCVKRHTDWTPGDKVIVGENGKIWNDLEMFVCCGLDIHTPSVHFKSMNLKCNHKCEHN